MASSPILSTGPAARTVVLVMPQLTASKPVPPSAMSGNAMPPAAPASSSFSCYLSAGFGF